MKKTPLYKLDLDLYYEKLDNGLEVYIVPKHNINDIYVTYSTKYGSIHNEFIPLGEKKMVKVPDGIAHFLEHKVFEQADGLDVFDFFSQRGSDLNANTSNFKTTYLFSGPDFYEENLNFLMDFVQEPYFNDKNIKKEQGIIEQEINMSNDNPYRKLYEGLYYNSFYKHPIKIPIIGTLKSINSINKEHLYQCYHTFYHPSNMFIVITGNIDPEKTIDIINKNQNKRKVEPSAGIKIKKYDEPDKVVKKSEIIEMDVTVPKAGILFKINFDKLKYLSLKKISNYIIYLCNLKLGTVSLLNEELRDEEIVKDNLNIDVSFVDKYAVLSVIADTDNPKELFKRIRKTLKSIMITEEEWSRFKKIIISNNIRMSDNIFSLNNRIMNDIIKYNEVTINELKDVEEYTIEEMNYVIQNISFENDTTLIINPSK
ncbi:MAG: pitrilysin family protein [Bacilli bacterium]|nr:pitrilysin family protein [Bacilli bacterium]MDD4809126.1 pitrilysin family protein [Bacilli bacterium]